MQTRVRRAAAFALVATLALAAPAIGALAAVPFALIAVIGRTVSEGPVFDLFARDTDRRAEELRGLVGVALAATALALLTALAGFPVAAFVATLLLVGYGNLVERIACDRDDAPIRRATVFGVGGAVAGVAGLAATGAIDGTGFDPPTAAFLAISGALVAALLRAVLVLDDDPLVLFSTAIALWILARVEVRVSIAGLALAVGVAGAFGYLSWYLDTASTTGVLTGVLISLLTIVLGGYGWFALLIAFFGLGGLASKLRYAEKREHGVAEDNEGARGGRNVLGNAAVALAAVVGFAASGSLGAPPGAFRFVFAGSLATAMSDTLSSEIGVLFGDPRLVTTMERVERGTDGGVSLPGSLAGLVGAAIVAGLAAPLLPVGVAGIALIVVAGVVGMFVDSLLGATVEGRWLGNQGVNFLATLAGGLLGAAGALGLGLA